MKLSVVLLAGVVALGSPGVLGAQARGSAKPEIPASSRPPAGMCRIWLDGVPAAQQPAPTDCASAVRNRPAKGRVIFGDDYVQRKDTATRDSGSKGRPVPVKGLAPVKSGETKRPPVRLRRP